MHIPPNHDTQIYDTKFYVCFIYLTGNYLFHVILSPLITSGQYSADNDQVTMGLVLKRSVKNVIKQKPFTLSVVLFVASCVIFLQTDWSPDLYYLSIRAFEDISCYYSYDGDGLPAIDERYNPPDNSIYFHETSCTGLLNSRQACAVESAAKVHPDRQVNLLFTGPVTEDNLNTPAFNALKKYKNIKVMRLHLVDYAKWTPLEELIKGGALNRTRWRISHTSDVLRFLSLYKWGGVYLDLDVVVVKSFDDLAPNWAARQSDRLVASGALSFSKDALGKQMADLALR